MRPMAKRSAPKSGPDLPYVVPDLFNEDRVAPVFHQTALLDGHRFLTYGDLLGRTFGCAGFLRDKGVSKGDRVGIFLGKSVDAVAALLGTYSAGGVAVVIHEKLRPVQVNHILQHSGASLLITEKRLRLYCPDPAIDENRVIDVEDIPRGSGAFSRPALVGADLAQIIYTSGSTGKPKGVMLSHDNLISGAKIVSDYLNLTERDRIISLLPFSFDYGLNQLLTSLWVKGTLVIQRSLLPSDISRTVENEKITGMAGVPTLWFQLVQGHSPFLKTAFPHLRYITNSGGSLPATIVEALRRNHPHVDIFLMYGLTEAFRSTYLPPSEVDRRPTSIGKAIPNTEILVVSEEGKLCGPGETGELVHRGAHVTLGYWKDPESTRAVFRKNPFQRSVGGWDETVVFSGDLVKQDSQGFLYFVGRKDQMIKSQGFRISPEEIESIVFSSGTVSQAVAFGVSNERLDHDIVVAVIVEDPATFSKASLQSYCKEKMPKFMNPREIWLLPQFPLTSSGKPDRVRIRQAYVEDHGRNQAIS